MACFEKVTFVPSYMSLKTDSSTAGKAAPTVVHCSVTECRRLACVAVHETGFAGQRTCHLWLRVWSSAGQWSRQNPFAVLGSHTYCGIAI